MKTKNSRVAMQEIEQDMNEKELIAKLCERVPQALAHSIDTYGGYVAAVIRRTLGGSACREDYEELVSDVFYTLWQHAPRLKPDSHLKPWLAVVARNHALKWVRKCRPTVELFEDDLQISTPPASAPLDRAEQNRMVRQAVDSLVTIDRNIFLRHYYWHQSIAQIALKTGMNESTIKSRLRRGRMVLKELLCAAESESENECENESENENERKALSK